MLNRPPVLDFQIETLPHASLPQLRDQVRDLLAIASDHHVQTVGLRLLNEIEGCIESGCPDMFYLVAVSGGDYLGVTNGSLISDRVGLSYHTLLLPGGHHRGCGAALFREKCRHLFALGANRIYACPESPNGIRLCEASGFRRYPRGSGELLLPWEAQRYVLTPEEFTGACLRQTIGAISSR